MDVLRCILDSRPPVVETLEAWWRATESIRARWAAPIERALVGGAHSDRLGFAFASGYVEALRALVPGLAGVAALCATEEAGAHPRAIETTLTPSAPGRYTLSGRKKWSTGATHAATLLVVARTGSVGGRNQLRVVSVSPEAPGVAMTPSTAPFVPEIPHSEVVLSGVQVAEADLLPGDGYADYLKPFRTVEDVHVHAALLGYLVGVARRHAFSYETIESWLALAGTARSLARCDPKSPATHLALAGALSFIAGGVRDIERSWSAVPDDEFRRWQRDRQLLEVAGAARASRRDKAWSSL